MAREDIMFANLSTLTKKPDIYGEILRVLDILKMESAALSVAEINDPEVMRWFSKNTQYLQAYYAKLERMYNAH